jgi:hypothetical protein
MKLQKCNSNPFCSRKRKKLKNKSKEMPNQAKAFLAES